MPMPSNGLNKLLEECGEVSQVAAKLSAYPDNNHPEGSDLIERLQEELADVRAAIEFVIMKHEIDPELIIRKRTAHKLALFCQWDKEG